MSTHRLIFPPSRRSPLAPSPCRLAPAPTRPPPSPPPRAPAPPQLQPRPSDHSELAVRSQRAPPGPGGHCLLSAPNPRPRNRRRPIRRRGRQRPKKAAGTRRAAAALFSRRAADLPLTWRFGAAGCRRPGRPGALSAHSRSVRSPSGSGGGLRAARSRAPGPGVTTEGLGALKSVIHPDAARFAVGALLLLEGPGCVPHRHQLLKAAFTAARWRLLWQAFFFFFFPFFLSFFFFNDLEEGREGTRPRVMISSPDSDVSAGNLQVAAPPPNSSPEGRYLDASEKQLRQIVGEWPQLRAGEF